MEAQGDGAVSNLLSEIVFMQPLRCRINDVGDGMFALAVPDLAIAYIRLSVTT